jgi:hypothetical protein
MTTHSNDNGAYAPRRGPRLGCLRRYARPPAPPLRGGLTARQSGELERIADRYGALRWHPRADGTIAIAILGDRFESDDEVLLMLMRSDGTVLRLSGRVQPRHDRISTELTAA